MRLNRFVAGASGLSRRAADAAISAGRITINDQPAGLGQTVEAADVVKLDGQTVTLPLGHRYIALNKPVGYVSSRGRQGSSKIIYDLLPPDAQNLRLAGRLDRQSSGLMLLSDDGDFILAMSHPSADKEKRYELELDHNLKPIDLDRLETGVELSDGISYLSISKVAGRRLVVSLEEGRNRQIRRTLGALGYTVTRLHRTAVGPHVLGDLAPGQWREITP